MSSNQTFLPPFLVYFYLYQLSIAEAQNLSGIQYSVIYHGHAREKLVLLGDAYGWEQGADFGQFAPMCGGCCTSLLSSF